MLMVHEARSDAGMEKSVSTPGAEKGSALLVTPTKCKPKYTTVDRQVVLRAMHEITVFIST